ncbi:MAG: lysophospholipid acyltransferase family protein [Porticoccaceae bacterium]
MSDNGISATIKGLRSAIFYLGFIGLIIIVSIITCVLFFLPFPTRQRIATTGNWLTMVWLRLTCNIVIVVEGRENIPEGPCVVLSNHQSTWETFYLQWFFQPASVILKHELLWIPFFGWALALMQPIGIKRSKPASAIRHVLKKGEQRLAAGNKIVIYPEGTRVRENHLGDFKTSGAALAKAANVSILPVAHNAGDHWPLVGFIKQPGIIRLKIGPAIQPSDKDVRALTEQARQWIKQALETPQ